MQFPSALSQWFSSNKQPLKRILEAEGPRHTQTVLFSILLKATLGGRLTILNKVLFDLGEFPYPPSLNSSGHHRNFVPICCLFSGFIHNLLKILYFSKWPILPNFPLVYEKECIRYQALGYWAIAVLQLPFHLLISLLPVHFSKPPRDGGQMSLSLHWQ